MTQGAIDLAQAELATPVESAVLLLQNKPYLGPRLLAAQPVPTKTPLLQAIANYTWWDSKTSICISIPISAELSAGRLVPEQVQCNIQQQQLQCTITTSTAHQIVQHRLSIAHLHAAIQPGQSTCSLNGHPVVLDQNKKAQPPSGSQTYHAALQSSESTTRRDLLQQCESVPQSSKQACNSPIASNQQPPASSLPCFSASHLQPLAASQPAATAAACGSQVLIRLVKTDPSKIWEKLMRPPPTSQPCKLAPPSEQSMAALRRTLIHQRQQTQAQRGKPVAGTRLAADATQAAVAARAKLLQASNITATPDPKSLSLPAIFITAGSSTDCHGATQRMSPDSVKVWRCQP